MSGEHGGRIQGQQRIVLPQPRERGSLSLEEALWLRRSVREFLDAPLTLETIGQLLWAAQGLSDPPDHRTAPSAGGTYPLEVYVLTSEGVFRYDTERHSLVSIASGDRRPQLHHASFEQQFVLDAPLIVVIAAVYARTARKYGIERGERYVHIEAGHAAENLLLQAAVEGLAAVPVGAFEDSLVQEALGLPLDQQPVCLIATGQPG
jgi:SagB-type dehydrogenase family enzyme